MKLRFVIVLTCMAAAAAQAQTGAGASGAGASSSGSAQGTTSSQGGVDAGTPGGTGTENSSTVDRSSFPPPRRDQSPPQGLRSDTNNNPTGLTQLTNQPGSTAQPSVETGGRSSGVASQGQTTQSTTNRYGQLGGGVLGGGTLPGQLNNGFQTNNGGLTPTSDRGATPNFYPTNRSQGVTNTMYSTNTTTSTWTRTLRQDIAVTMADRVVLTQIRRQTAPVLTQITTTRPAGSTSPWMPIHFAVQQGVVTLVGTVPTVQESQQVVTMVQQVPGVVHVINQLRSVDEQTTVAGFSGWNAGATNRGTWQSGSDVAASTNTTTGTGIVASTNNTSGLGIVSATNTWDPALLPTSDRTNGGSRIYGTNQASGQTNRWTVSTNRTGLPPGLQNRDPMPPGLQRRLDNSVTNR